MGNNPRNAEYTKEYNRHMFLRLLREAPMSRVEITKRLGLTRSATTLIADELLSDGLIMETEIASDSLRGRPPMPLAIRGEAAYAIGIYLSRTGFKAGVVDMCDKLITKIELSFDSNMGRDKTALLISTIKQLIDDCDIPGEKICGIGISCPGPINEVEGRILNAPHFKLWANTNIGPKVKEALNLPIYMEKDAACLARYNAGRGNETSSKDFLLLLLEGGVGSGIVSGGQLLKTLGGYTCEIGHCTIDINGPKCECGNVGCLENYASLNKLIAGSKYKNWKDVIDHRSEDGAKDLINKEARYLSTGIVTAANIVSIDTVLLAGDILYGSEYISPVIEEMVNKMLIQRDQLQVKIAKASMDPDYEIISAADTAFDHFLNI